MFAKFKYTTILNASILISFVMLPFSGNAWSKKGHQVTASIAQKHMTRTTYSAVTSLLDGDTPVYWAAWLDSARNDPEYQHTSTWHYLNVNANETYENRYREPAGDAVSAVYWAWDVLTDDAASRYDKQLAIKVVIHVIADIHQPMHVGHKSDSGGNSIKLYYEGSSTNLHSLWDYTVVENAHNWSYSEWQRNIDVLSEEENARRAEGTADDWAKENVALAARIYKAFPKYMNVTGGDLDLWAEDVENLFLNGGLRLARWLNMAFDKEFVDEAQIEADPAEQLTEVYSLSGICLRRGVTMGEAIEGLAPGLYIINHQKIRIR